MKYIIIKIQNRILLNLKRPIFKNKKKIFKNDSINQVEEQNFIYMDFSYIIRNIHQIKIFSNFIIELKYSKS